MSVPIVTQQAVHASVGGAPKIITGVASDAIPAQRFFSGVGAPSATTLLAGNGKYNAAQSGWVISASSVAGANYEPGDVLTDGNIQITVLQVDVNGFPLNWYVSHYGSYGPFPSNPVSMSGGSGTGAQFNLNFPAPDLYVDMTTPTAPVVYICTASGTNASATWSKISGGSGSSIQQMSILSVPNADYVLTTGGIYVAKTPLARAIVTSTWNGPNGEVVIDYSNYTDNNNSRQATDNINQPETQILYPPYRCAQQPNAPNVGVFIADPAQNTVSAAIYTGGTGMLDPNNNPIVWQELPGRGWMTLYGEA